MNTPVMGSLSLSNFSMSPPLLCRKGSGHYRVSTNNFVVVSCSRDEENGKVFSGYPKFEGNGADILQAPFLSPDKGTPTNPNDIAKLFNDAQQNILYLNKQRLLAMEELKKVHREKELLLATLGKKEAEAQSNIAECEVLKQKLNLVETTMTTGGTWNLQKSKKHSRVKVDPSPLFSEILLRIDSMVLVGDITKTQASEMRKLVVNKDPVLAETFCNLKHMDGKELAAGLLPLLDPKGRQGLYIVQICTEMAPIVKVGSMASHVKDLCCALQRRRNLVEVILPMYKSVDLTQVQGLQEIEADFYSYFGGERHKNKIWTGIMYGIAVTFIEPFHPSGFFDRDLLYGYGDDFERFTYFSRASLDYLLKSGKQPDILHLHNWQTAAVAPLFWDIFVNQGLGSTRILFTCHNFEFQCVEEPRKLKLCGLDPERLHRPDRLQDNRDSRLINLLKGGIVYSNNVVTVSTPYGNAELMKENRHGLETTLSIHKNKVISVPYGLDDTVWDPANDKFLPATYSAQDLSGKATCKVALRRHVGLSETEASNAIVGCACMDMSDADLNFIKLALKSAPRNGAQFVLMGTSKNPRMQAGLEELQKDFKKNVTVISRHDEGMLHLLIAGSDILLCSSFHDPENQMPLKALKYGAVPIARRGESTSFTLHSTKFSDEALSWTQVLIRMKDDPLGWTNLVKDGMVKDFSWDAECADRYTAAYWSIHQL